MTTVLRPSALACAVLLFSTVALAQTPPPAQTPAPSSSDATTRPATTTFFGDTGIWYVPTAEVLDGGKWSASVYRRGTNWIQGYTNVADFAGTFAYGLKGRAEIFGSFLVDTRIDRDLRPLFVSDPSFGGVIDRYPRVAQPWTGDNVGDLYLGAKINLWSESRHNPAAIAVRGMVKLPTGKKDVGVSTGKADGSIDLIVSKEAAKLVEISGFGGYEFRGSPDNYDAPTGAFRWGTGVAFPSRNFLRVSAELNGDVPNKDTIIFSGVQALCVNCGFPPLVSNTSNLTRATLGLTFQAKSGFFAGAGVSWNMPTRARSSLFTDEPDVIGDYYDMQFRIGYHPGARTIPPPAMKCEDPKALNYGGPLPCSYPPPTTSAHELSVKADCGTCSVEVGRTIPVTATVHDSIGCAVTYRWTSPTGTPTEPAALTTPWTAPVQPGVVPVTITVTCPSDGKTATDTVNINVIRNPPPPPIVLEDVYFEFDRYTLRPDAIRLLDDAVRQLLANPDKDIVIEGHTCNIGTAEYNLALGDRRANSVKDYLTSRGVAASRLQTRSYGEETPKYSNEREETRRLNRRAALIVRVQ